MRQLSAPSPVLTDGDRGKPRLLTTYFSRETGRRPVGRPRWKARSAAAIWQQKYYWKEPAVRKVYSNPLFDLILICRKAEMNLMPVLFPRRESIARYPRLSRRLEAHR